MALGIVMPLPKLQLFDDNGDPASGYQLFTYKAGLTDKLDTYSDANLTVANDNPIVLDSAGRATVFLSDNAYKFVFTTPTDTDPPTSPIWTVDGVRGTPTSSANIDVAGIAGETLVAGETAYMSDGSGSLTAGRWYLTSSDHNYASVDAPSVGIVMVGGTVGSTVSARTNGRATVSGTLSQGAVYYLGATPGTLDSSPTQQNRCPFGQADTTTSIVFPIQGTISISIKEALATFAYSATPAGNAAGGGDTEMTSYTKTIPDNFLNNPGASLVIEGLFAAAENTNAKTVKISIGSSGKKTLFTSADSVANHTIPFRCYITRRSPTTASCTGLFHYKVGPYGDATPYLTNSTLTGIDWTAAQDLKIWLVGTATNDIFLTDYFVYQIRSPYGTLV